MIFHRNSTLAIFALVVLAAGDVNSADVGQEPIDDVYVFYLHGRIVENEGPTPAHEAYGPYDYPAIVDTLESRGAIVVSEIRPAGTDVNEYALKVISYIENLLDDGGDSSQIVVVGFSKGGVIAI